MPDVLAVVQNNRAINLLKALSILTLISVSLFGLEPKAR